MRRFSSLRAGRFDVVGRGHIRANERADRFHVFARSGEGFNTIDTAIHREQPLRLGDIDRDPFRSLPRGDSVYMKAFHAARPAEFDRIVKVPMQARGKFARYGCRSFQVLRRKIPRQAVRVVFACADFIDAIDRRARVRDSRIAFARAESGAALRATIFN